MARKDRKITPLVSSATLADILKGQLNSFRRRTLRDVWQIGETLIDLRKAVHEEKGSQTGFARAAVNAGMSVPMAYRWMSIRKNYPDLKKLLSMHGTAGSALQALEVKGETGGDNDADFLPKEQGDGPESSQNEKIPDEDGGAESSQNEKIPDEGDGVVAVPSSQTTADAVDAEFSDAEAPESKPRKCASCGKEATHALPEDPNTPTLCERHHKYAMEARHNETIPKHWIGAQADVFWMLPKDQQRDWLLRRLRELFEARAEIERLKREA